jgi:NTP pyrophosphatase (non-canonical NTP hydrolase)
MITPDVPVTDREAGFIGLLQEEGAEVIQILSKVRRFGWESRNPYIPGSKTNRQLTEDEIGDVLAVTALLVKEGAVNLDDIAKRVVWKLEKLRALGYTPSEITTSPLGE